MGLPKSKVALVTGAARSQRRSHAISIDAVGTDIIALDIHSKDVATVRCDPATQVGLQETARFVELLGLRIVSGVGDARGLGQVQNVNRRMNMYQALFDRAAPHIDIPGVDDVQGAFASLDPLPDLPWIQSNHVSDTVLWSPSDHAKFITGVALPADAGTTVKKGNCSI
jgi:hypothetical protein